MMEERHRSCSTKSSMDIYSRSDKRKSHPWWLKCSKLYAYDQVPKHLQTNPFIRHGYRHDLSWSECLLSFFRFHNETLNVWSHFLGFILFSSYFVRDFILSKSHHQLFSTTNIDDYFMLLFYVLCIICCMIASTMLHLLSGCSINVYNSCMQLDLLGIALASLASFFIGLHLLFKCHFYTRVFYQLAIILLIAFVLVHYCSKHEHEIDSTGFIAVALAGFVPLCHWIYLHEYNANVSYFVSNIIVFYLIFGVGVFFFRTRIPERFAPGYFDYVGASHQLWHLLSLFAFYWWYNHSVELIQHHQTFTCTRVFTNIKELK